MKKHILIIGSGGREHALAWKLKQSPEVGRITCAPGNGGIAHIAQCITLADPSAITAFCQAEAVDLVVIGPEQPLVEGLADVLRAHNIAVFGPSAQAAQLEGSKAFTKRLCAKYHIPTAAYGEFTDVETAQHYLADKRYPIVIKVDGLAAGKGVIIAENANEARAAVADMFSGTFGKAGVRIVIEEFLHGEEVSFFALADGDTAIEFGHAQDHKRAFDGDTGPNTGGMGTYAPAAIMTDAMRARVMREIIHPTMAAMKAEGMPFQGVLFAGLMLTEHGPQLLEYNTRFGDPETQVLMRRLTSDLYPLLLASAQGNLKGMQVHTAPEAALCVVMAAKGYPGAYEKGSIIGGLDRAEAVPGCVVFHAGTAQRGPAIIATGGRVLGVTALGATVAQAQSAAYEAVDRVEWPEGFCRRDIGWRAATATAGAV